MTKVPASLELVLSPEGIHCNRHGQRTTVRVIAPDGVRVGYVCADCESEAVMYNQKHNPPAPWWKAFW